MPTHFEYNNCSKKKWCEYNDDDPLPELPWINNDKIDNKNDNNLSEDNNWITVNKKKR